MLRETMSKPTSKLKSNCLTDRLIRASDYAYKTIQLAIRAIWGEVRLVNVRHCRQKLARQSSFSDATMLPAKKRFNA